MSWREIPCVGFKLYFLKSTSSVSLFLPFLQPKKSYIYPCLFTCFPHTTPSPLNYHYCYYFFYFSSTKNISSMDFTFLFLLPFASICFILCFYLFLKFISSNGRNLPLPPGTLGWPYIGETFELYSQNPNVFFASKVKRLILKPVLVHLAVAY